MGRRAGFAITRDDILQAGVRLVREGGVDALRIRAVARALGVRPSALYNHIQGNAELRTAVAIRGWQALLEELPAPGGATSLLDWAQRYRAFALAEPGLYALMTEAALPWDHPGVAEVTARAALALSTLGVSGPDAVHLVRGSRSLIHGFVQLERAGQFSHAVPADETFEVLVHALLSGFQSAGDKGG